MVADCSTRKKKRNESDGSDVCKPKQTGVFEFFVVPDKAVRGYGILGDGAFYMGQTLRIREGPLKGYLCRVVALRRSEFNNQVLTVTCELLGEVHRNNSANYTRMDPDLSSEKLELIGMQEWMEEVQSGTAENDGWNAGGGWAERTSRGQRTNQSCNAFIKGVNFGSRGRNWTWGSRSWGSSDRDGSVGRSSYGGGLHGRGNSDRSGFGGMGRVNDWTRWGGRSGCTSDRAGLPGRGNFDRGRFGGSCGVSNWNASKSFDDRWSSSARSFAGGNENGEEKFDYRHSGNWGDNGGVRDSFYRGDFCRSGGIGERGFRCRGDSDRVSFGDKGCSDRGGFGRRGCWRDQSFSWNSCNGSGGWKGDWNSGNITDEKKSLNFGKQNSNDRWKGSWNSSTDNCGKSSNWSKQANNKSNGWQGHDATNSWQPSITFCCAQGSGSNQSTSGNEASGYHHEKFSSWAERAHKDRQELTSSDAGNSWSEECSSKWIQPIASGARLGWNQSATANDASGDLKSSVGMTNSDVGISWNEGSGSTCKPPIATSEGGCQS